uniref:Major facilitator superfamily (MFS) profile domain-containing protein n=1 Tax=Parascaris univalens TaxID=6257 RepID=A0A915B312_PARUN
GFNMPAFWLDFDYAHYVRAQSFAVNWRLYGGIWACGSSQVCYSHRYLFLISNRCMTPDRRFVRLLWCSEAVAITISVVYDEVIE